MIGITGERSSITKEFIKIVGKDNVVFGSIESLPRDLDIYLLCAGVLIGKSASDITLEESIETLRVNFIEIVKFCDEVFSINENARICIIGSESGYSGSYDVVYAGSKSALHLYVETKKLKTKGQHLVAVAPTIIEDSGMTQRRLDLENVIAVGEKRRMGRWLKAEEVARVVDFALQEPSLSNTVIRMTGGNW